VVEEGVLRSSGSAEYEEAQDDENEEIERVVVHKGEQDGFLGSILSQSLLLFLLILFLFVTLHLTGDSTITKREQSNSQHQIK